MTTQDFTDAFILMLSGAAEWYNEREIKWISTKGYGPITIEFVDNNPLHHVTRCYRSDRSKEWEVESFNGCYTHGSQWWRNGDIRHWNSLGELTARMSYRNGKKK